MRSGFSPSAGRDGGKNRFCHGWIPGSLIFIFTVKDKSKTTAGHTLWRCSPSHPVGMCIKSETFALGVHHGDPDGERERDDMVCAELEEGE